MEMLRVACEPVHSLNKALGKIKIKNATA
jgi:hypothetical protein